MLGMAGSMRQWTVALALISIAGPSLACTVVYHGVVVGSNFRVKVEDKGHPVKGLAVQLYRTGAGKIQAVTDKNGLALFRDVPPGAYHLNADHDAGIPDGAEIEVRAQHLSEITVPLRWPSATLVTVASLKGVLHLPDQIPGQPQALISLQLLEGVSGRKLRTANTDEKGAFEFPGVGSGLYFLRLSGLTGLDGVIPISVEPSVATASLDLDLGWTSCGLFYSDRSQCPQTDLHMDRLAGRVVDQTGAAIPGAEVLLSYVSGNLMQRVRNQNTGEFDSLRPADGTYQLIVRANGFTTLRRTLIVEPNGTSSLEVRLGILGLCSDTKAQ